MSSTVFGKRTDANLPQMSARAVSSDSVRLELGRIVASRTFQHAKNDKLFLQYAVEQTLAGYADQIKEYSVGAEVFHRGERFDPRIDPIVRIQARSLRTRLAQYYETEGKSDPIEIRLPKGTYVPVFAARDAETICGAGDGAIALVSESAGNSVSAEGASPRSQSAVNRNLPRRNSARPLRWRRTATATAFICFAAVAGIYLFHARGRQVNASSETPSIAILPFQNQSDGKGDDFFSDGLTDELIDSFARLPNVRVVGRTSVYQFKGKSDDIRSIAHKLNVRNVLEGTLRRYGNRIRITAELEDAATGYTVWSDTYDRDVQDALGIQREISSIIADSLGLKLAAAPSSHGVKAYAASVPVALNSRNVQPGAYENYLKGRYFFDHDSAQGVQTAIGYFQQAITQDSNFAPAYMGLAHCYVQQITLVDSASPSENLPKAIAIADKAIQLDGSLGEAHLDLAIAYEMSYDWAAAGQEFHKALDLSPGDFLIHLVYSTYLQRTSLPQNALEEARLALQLDPVSPRAAATTARALFYTGDFEGSIERYRQALELDPTSAMTHLALAETYAYQGMYPQELMELDSAQRVSDVGSSGKLLGLRGYAYGRSGDVQRARQNLDKLLTQRRDPARLLPALPVAYVYIGLGDHDNAFRYLEKAASQHENDLLLLNVNPIFAPLRSDPRFLDLRRKLHL